MAKELEYGARRHWIERAMKAYRRTDDDASPPHESQSDVEHVHGENYAVLRNSHGMLAVYRIAGDARLRRMASPPREIVEAG
jgi:hypothetical protein